jgi:LPS export ABC transporter permease LptF
MKILRRYIWLEMITPTLLGFGFYTFIILMRNLFDLAEMIIKRSLPVETVFKLLALSLPHIIVLTIPMSLLFGILIAIGRLSSDSEIIAMRAAGLSMTTIYRPVLYFSLLIFAVNLYFMNVVLPRGNSALQGLRTEIFASSVERELQPRVFYDEYENLVIYVNGVDPATGTWQGVFVSDSTNPRAQRIVIARSGRIAQTVGGRQLWLDLHDATTHGFSPARPERYELTSSGTLRFLLSDRFAAEGQSVSAAKSYRAMTLAELLVQRRSDRDPSDLRLIDVEIHKKFAIPFACLSFGILGLPLGITNRRGGKSSGFTLSIGIILFYYVLITNGEDMAKAGRFPPALAMWLPNVVLVALGLYLMRRANIDTGGSDTSRRWYQRILRRLRRWQRRRTAAAANGEGTSLLTRLDIAFPNILDRYILKQFASVLLMVLMSVLVLFVVIDYTDLAGEIAENRITFPVIASYYRYYILQVLNLTIPISVLLGTLITFGILAKNNEVTALKANGVSLYRVTLPIIAVATIISGVSYLLQDFVLPHANQRVVELKAQIKGRVTPRAFSIQQRQWLFGQGRYMFNFLSYDQNAQTLRQVQVFELDEKEFVLQRRIFAQEARFDGVGWVFVDGWIRKFGEHGEVGYSPIVQPARMHYPERPEYFSQDVRCPAARRACGAAAAPGRRTRGARWPRGSRSRGPPPTRSCRRRCPAGRPPSGGS